MQGSIAGACQMAYTGQIDCRCGGQQPRGIGLRAVAVQGGFMSCAGCEVQALLAMLEAELSLCRAQTLEIVNPHCPSLCASPSAASRPILQKHSSPCTWLVITADLLMPEARSGLAPHSRRAQRKASSTCSCGMSLRNQSARSCASQKNVCSCNSHAVPSPALHRQ